MSGVINKSNNSHKTSVTFVEDTLLIFMLMTQFTDNALAVMGMTLFVHILSNYTLTGKLVHSKTS